MIAASNDPQAAILRYREIIRDLDSGVVRKCGCHRDLAILRAAMTLAHAASCFRSSTLTPSDIRQLRAQAKALKELGVTPELQSDG